MKLYQNSIAKNYKTLIVRLIKEMGMESIHSL
jgi:hypothetical protein